ncbi:MAG TPA: hypothetical protein VFH61_06070 [Thermoleophilia bacterium]|nr:hypothetical protein [Thermoleophilia bacterium]
MAVCEACGNECPAGAVFCAACGHRLGDEPAEPITVNVRLVDSPLRGVWSCLMTFVSVVVLAVIAMLVFGC